MKMINGAPRRVRLDHLTEEEAELYAIHQKIECLGADPLLMDASELIRQAADKLADWVEKENPTTLQELLQMTVSGRDKDGNLIDFPPEFRVAVQEKTKQGVRIIVHAYDHNSETLDFWVQEDQLERA